jgi:molybdopterin-guanine dinucleotide biosynthesis protein A
VSQRIVGVVLAGGASKRLGSDKAALDVGGDTLLGRTVELLRGLTAEVAVSGRDPAPLQVDAPWFPDALEGIGPMGGIMAALDRFKAPCFAVSCDLPFLSRDVLALLLWAREDRGPKQFMTTFHDPVTGYVESLVAIYEPEALPLLVNAAALGQYKLSAALPPEHRVHAPYPENRARVFMNINRPEDLERYRELENRAHEE